MEPNPLNMLAEIRPTPSKNHIESHTEGMEDVNNAHIIVRGIGILPRGNAIFMMFLDCDLWGYKI